MGTSTRRNLRAVLMSSVLTLVAALLAPAARAAPPRDCTPDEILVNPCRPLLGAYSNTYPGISGWRAHMDAEEARIGRPLDIVHLYHPPNSPLPLLPDERYFATRDKTAMFVNWKPGATSWADAAGGNDVVNAQIDEVADSIKAIAPVKIMLTLHHEPEDDVTPGTSGCPGLKGTYGSPEDYRAMWRNVEGRFDARGVTNVVWVMNFMGYSNWDCLVPDLWPGNELVDWVMFDPYDTVSTSSWSASVSRFYNWMIANRDATHDYVSKPWGLAEFGVGGKTTQAHAYTYYDDARASVERNQFDRLKAYVAFDSEGIVHTKTSYSVAGVYDPVEQEHFNSFANSAVFLDSPADDTPPTITLVTPTAVNSVYGSVQIRAATSDNYEVTRTTYAVDGGPASPMALSTDGTASAVWDSTSAVDGPHSLEVSASDAAGNTATATAQLTVANADKTRPTTPANLQTVSVTSDALDLTWDAATDDRGVTGYRIRRDGATLWTGADTKVTDSTIQPATSYSYTVQAHDAAGNFSAESPPLMVSTSALPDTTPPTTPALTAVASGDNALLSWTAADDDTGVEGYRVFRAGTLISTVAAATRTYTDTSVEQGKSYSYTVKAFDLAGNLSQPSNAPQVNIPDSTPPTAPTSAAAVEQAALGGVSVSWQPSSDNVGVSGYSVWRNGTVLGTVATPGYLDASTAPGLTYTYTVKAHDAAGNVSAASDTAQVTTADTVAPATPLTPSASLSGSTVNLTWLATTDNVGVQGYRVLRDGSSIASLPGTSFTDTTAPQGVSHSYVIVAYDAANNLSADSPALTLTVPDTTAPATPAAPIVSLVNGAGALSWTPPSDNVGVVKFLVKRNGGALVTTTGTSYTDATLTQGRTYTYTVTAYDAAGNASAASPSASLVVPDTIAPTTPTSFKVVAGIGKATLTWAASTDNVGVAGYQIWRGTTRLTNVAGVSYSNTGLTKGKSYSYKIRAYDAKGNLSPFTASITVKVG